MLHLKVEASDGEFYCTRKQSLLKKVKVSKAKKKKKDK